MATLACQYVNDLKLTPFPNNFLVLHTFDPQIAYRAGCNCERECTSQIVKKKSVLNQSKMLEKRLFRTS